MFDIDWDETITPPYTPEDLDREVDYSASITILRGELENGR